MKVFFTASYYGKRRYQEYYNLVLKTIKKYEDDIVSPELGNYLMLLSDKEKRKFKDLRAIHYEAIRRGIALSDVAILEISHQDFQLGHESTIAVQSKKPVLCLSLHEDMSRKIKNRYFHGAHYNEDNIDEIISEFLTKYKKELYSQRFNMFLSAKQTKYLSNRAEESGMNMSEFVRDLIEEDIKRYN